MAVATAMKGADSPWHARLGWGPIRMMSDVRQLNSAVADLVGVTRQLAEQVQRVTVHLERETTRLPEANELPVILSELSELHQRLRKLAATPA
jgi:hypothetical protein